jgi:hypothetical protein
MRAWLGGEGLVDDPLGGAGDWRIQADGAQMAGQMDEELFSPSLRRRGSGARSGGRGKSREKFRVEGKYKVSGPQAASSEKLSCACRLGLPRLPPDIRLLYIVYATSSHRHLIARLYFYMYCLVTFSLQNQNFSAAPDPPSDLGLLDQ